MKNVFRNKQKFKTGSVYLDPCIFGIAQATPEGHDV